MAGDVEIQLSDNKDVRICVGAVSKTVWYIYARLAEILMKQHWKHFGAKL